MPYKSRAQRSYLHAAAERGDVPKSVVEEFDRESKGQKNLPARVKTDLAGRRKSTRKSNITGNRY